MSRDAPPPLPGGYKVGEKVFYTGVSQTLAAGYELVHGQQGEVMGPATCESHKGKGVNVLFLSNKVAVSCWLISVRRRRRRAQPPTAPHRLSCPSSQPS